MSDINEFTISKQSKLLSNANLLKKYHANLIYDYTEYPTKGNWSEKFNSESYKNAVIDINFTTVTRC